MRWLLALPLLTACGTTLGDASADLNRGFIIPYLMADGDVASACAVGESLGPMIQSFAGDSRKAARASVLSAVSAAMCMEDPIREADLASLREMRAGRYSEAEDHNQRIKRMHTVAAGRYLDVWDRLAATYGIPEPGAACPKFKNDTDALTYVMGLSAGLLAVVHDAQGGGGVVPMDIPAGVVRGSTCVDDAQWWGAGAAMRAAVFVVQPGHPEANDPWATFASAVASGEAAGVRLTRAFQVQGAASLGDVDRIKAFIREDAAHRAAHPANERWAMLDTYALHITMHESDRLWTQLNGYRTPAGAYGTFPDDAPAALLEFPLLLDLE